MSDRWITLEIEPERRPVAVGIPVPPPRRHRAWSAVIGERLTWDLAADVDPQAGTLENADASLETDRGRLAGRGAFAWESAATSAQLDLAYTDLAPLGQILGSDLGGRLTATAAVTSPGPLGVFDAELTGRIADPVLPDPVAQSLAAPSLDFRTRVALEESGALSLTGLDLASAAARQRSSRKRGAMICTPKGTPSCRPVGTATAGSPSRLTL